MANNRFVTSTRKFGAGKNKTDLSIVILGGSIGYRMKSYGPKSLIKLSTGESILDNQISVIAMAYPNCEIVLTAGFEADKVIKRRPDHIRIIENQLYETTNTLEEIRLALNNCINEHILFIQGEMIFNLEAINGITHDCVSAILVDSKNHMPEEEVGATVVNDKVSILSYGLAPKWCNIAYVTGKELKFLKSIAADKDKGKLYLFEALNVVLDKRGSFKAYTHPSMSVNKIESSKDII